MIAGLLCLFFLLLNQSSDANAGGLFSTGFLPNGSGGPAVVYPVSTSKYVRVKGSWLLSQSGSKFAAFKDIPFAHPPTGKLRFKPPIEPVFTANETVIVSRPEGVVHDLNSVPICAQGPFPPIYTTNSGREDCLYLSVYSKAIKDKKLLPVMVFIHGGKLTSGTGIYEGSGPNLLMNKRIVLVSINYRLGPLGFLSLGTKEVPGNAGFLDQVMALKWVQKHIYHFGGDKNKVTIFGESAGGWSVGFHMISPRSRGLFHRAILMSGSPLMPVMRSWFHDSSRTGKLSTSYTHKLFCRKGELKCLQKKPLHKILEASKDFNWVGNYDGNYTSVPFFPEDIETAFETTDFSGLEVIVGVNQDEGLMLTSHADDPGLSIAVIFFPFTCAFHKKDFFGIPKENEVTMQKHKCTKLRKFYKVRNAEARPAMTQFMTDSFFWYPADRLVRLLASRGVKTYQYVFSHRGEHNFLVDYMEKDKRVAEGVTHIDDQMYLLQPLINRTYTFNRLDNIVSNFMTTAWTNFATNGRPLPASSPTAWDPVDVNNHQYFNISSASPGMQFGGDYGSRMRFWRRFFESDVEEEILVEDDLDERQDDQKEVSDEVDGDEDETEDEDGDFEDVDK